MRGEDVSRGGKGAGGYDKEDVGGAGRGGEEIDAEIKRLGSLGIKVDGTVRDRPQQTPKLFLIRRLAIDGEAPPLGYADGREHIPCDVRLDQGGGKGM